MLTVGWFELTRATAGNAYQWAVVARGRSPDAHQDIYLVAQFAQQLDNFKNEELTSSSGSVLQPVLSRKHAIAVYADFTMSKTTVKDLLGGDKAFIKKPDQSTWKQVG